MRKLLLIILTLLVGEFLYSQTQVNFYADSTVVCYGFPVHFADSTHADTIVSWYWDFGDGNTSTLQDPVHNYDTAGVFSVMLVVGDTTPVYDTLVKINYITVKDTPTANFIVIDTILYPSFYCVFIADSDSASTYHYSWNFDGTLLPDTEKEMYHVFQTEGEKTVYLIVDNYAAGECVDTAFQTIQVTDSINIPNVFTPNGDGINDIFQFKTNGVTTYKLDVYNRWGAIVYEFKGKRIYWDGYSSAGVWVESGTYYYVLTSEDGSYSKYGFVFLVH